MTRTLNDRGPSGRPEPDPAADADPADGHATDADGPETVLGGFDRLRLLLAAAMGTVLVSYAMLVPSAVAVVATAGGGLSLDGAFGAAIPLWLAAHHIPMALEGRPLSVLPLLPTAVVLLVVAFGAGWAVRRLGGRSGSEAGAVVAAIAGAHAAVAVLGSALLPATAAIVVAPWPAMLGSGLVAAIGAAFGVWHRCGVPESWLAVVPMWLRHALLAAATAVCALLLIGSLVLGVGVLLRGGQVTDSFAALAPDGGSGVGLALLVLGYLPNAVIAGAGWALGPGVAVGTATASPFAAFPGAAPPPFPLLAVLPESSPPPWAMAVLLAPVLVGVLTGVRCRRAAAADRLPATVGATVLAAVAMTLLAGLAGGRLAAGPFDPVQVPPLLVGASVLLWVGAPALLLFLLRPAVGSPAADAPADAEHADPEFADVEYADPEDADAEYADAEYDELEHPDVEHDADHAHLDVDPAADEPDDRVGESRARDRADREQDDEDEPDHPSGAAGAPTTPAVVPDDQDPARDAGYATAVEPDPAERPSGRPPPGTGQSGAPRARARRGRSSRTVREPRTPQQEREDRAAKRAARAARRTGSSREAGPPVEPAATGPDPRTDPVAPAEPPRPRTVAELVAQRAEQARRDAEAAARDADREADHEDGPGGADRD